MLYINVPLIDDLLQFPRVTGLNYQAEKPVERAAVVAVRKWLRSRSLAGHASTPPLTQERRSCTRVPMEAWENSKSAMSPLPLVEFGSFFSGVGWYVDRFLTFSSDRVGFLWGCLCPLRRSAFRLYLSTLLKQVFGVRLQD